MAPYGVGEVRVVFSGKLAVVGGLHENIPGNSLIDELDFCREASIGQIDNQVKDKHIWRAILDEGDCLIIPPATVFATYSVEKGSISTSCLRWGWLPESNSDAIVKTTEAVLSLSECFAKADDEGPTEGEYKKGVEMWQEHLKKKR